MEQTRESPNAFFPNSFIYIINNERVLTIHPRYTKVRHSTLVTVINFISLTLFPKLILDLATSRFINSGTLIYSLFPIQSLLFPFTISLSRSRPFRDLTQWAHLFLKQVTERRAYLPYPLSILGKVLLSSAKLSPSHAMAKSKGNTVTS